VEVAPGIGAEIAENLSRDDRRRDGIGFEGVPLEPLALKIAD